MREFFLTFGFIFLAAFPGRTTFVLLLLATSVRPRRLLAGSLPAFIIQCGIAVLIGGRLRTVPHRYIQLAAGILFVYFAVKFWRESMARHEPQRTLTERSIGSIFILFFVAELGDVSQLAVAARAAQVDAGWIVFLGSAGAMSAIALLCAYAGRILTARMRPAKLQQGAAVFFLILGGYLIFQALTMMRA